MGEHLPDNSIEDEEKEIAERLSRKWTGVDRPNDTGLMPYLAALVMILSIVVLILRIWRIL
jgi:hypothetical protein